MGLVRTDKVGFAGLALETVDVQVFGEITVGVLVGRRGLGRGDREYDGLSSKTRILGFQIFVRG